MPDGDANAQQQTGAPAGAPDPSPHSSPDTHPTTPMPSDWRASLPPELRDAPSIQKFQDPAALAKSYTELEKQRTKFADEAKVGARAAVEAELFGKRPESADKYEVGLPEDAGDLVLLTEPPGADFAPEPGKAYLVLKGDDPLLGEFRQIAHRAGLDQGEFNAAVAKFGRALAARVPTAEERQAQDAEVFKALGEHGERRVQHLWGQLQGTLGDRAKALDELVGSAAAVEALEMLVERAGAPKFSPPTGGAAGRLTEAELREKMRDPRYTGRGRPRDPDYIAEIDRGWRTLYPN